MAEAHIESFLPEPVSDETFEALARVYEYDSGIALDAAIVTSVSFNKDFEVCDQASNPDDEVHHTREKIVFTGLLNTRVPGHLAIPAGATHPLPCVLLLDGIGGSKDRWWEKDGWPRGPLAIGALLNAGYAVLALDAQLHGERSERNDFEPPASLAWGETPRLNTLLNAVALSVVECRRALDYLATRADIDSQRTGVLGHSMGAMMAFALSGIEPRLKAAVGCVVPMFPHRRICPLTPHHFAARNGTVPFLMLMGREDGVTSEEESVYLYEQIATHKKKRVLYDSGHRLPPEYVPEAAAWFREHLE